MAQSKKDVYRSLTIITIALVLIMGSFGVPGGCGGKDSASLGDGGSPDVGYRDDGSGEPSGDNGIGSEGPGNTSDEPTSVPLPFACENNPNSNGFHAGNGDSIPYEMCTVGQFLRLGSRP